MKKINFLFLFFLGFYLNGYCQSKKEQIEILTFQNDSLRNLLSKNSESFEIEKNYLNSKINKNNTKIAELNSEIAQLNSRNLELKNTNSNYAEEVSILKNQVLSLNKKLDSISNLKYGELLQPKPDTDETSDDCIYNYYYNESTIELPQNIKEISAGGISFVDILPVGWSKEGLFAYNWVAQSECGKIGRAHV